MYSIRYYVTELNVLYFYAIIINDVVVFDGKSFFNQKGGSIMIVKRAFVSWMNPCKTFSIIEKTLASRPNTQIFVSREIVKHLPFAKPLNSVSSYNEDLMDWHGYESRCTYTHAGFAPITKEYMHLAVYHSDEHEIEYFHYKAGIKKLLLIEFEP
jgi:hypothetical protein